MIITTSLQARGYKPKYKILVGLLSLASVIYATLFYTADAMSERDYSVIGDPRLRVGYCMASNTFNPEKYLLAETIARSPDTNMYVVVMPRVLEGVNTEQKRAALLALRERDELRAQAIRSSFRVADDCGFRKVAWPEGTTPLDISIKWLRDDPTYLYFLARVRSVPDAAERFYHVLSGSKAGTRAANS